MKDIMKLGLLFVLVLSIFVVACGEKEMKTKEDSTSTPVNESKADEDIAQAVEESDDYMASLLKDAAQKEGVSVKELEKTLDKLAELGGEKYGVTKEAYIKQIEESGSSVLEEWTLASETMGMSISELYEAEKASMATRSDEEKETLEAMANALAEVTDMDLDEIQGQEDMNALLGITENTSGEIRIVDGKFEDDFYYKADDVAFEYEDDYSITVEYYAKEDIDQILEYYVELLENTKDYLLLTPYGVPGGMIQGYYNEMAVYVEITDEGDGRPHVTCYLDYMSKE